MHALLHALLALAGASVLAAACGPPAPSSSDCNVQLLPGDLVITEVFADFKATAGSTGADAGKEWFEIYNAKGQPIDLAGLTITHGRISGDRPKTHTISAGSIAPGQFFTLGNAAPASVPAYVDHGYGTELGDLFNTDGGQLTLSCQDSEIDSAAYAAIQEGHARALTAAQAPEYTLNDDPSQWCQASGAEFEAGNFGTPGAENDCRPIVAGQCNEGGRMRDAVAPGPGDLVITEVMPSPNKVSDTTGEWFEAKVVHDVDLNGVGLDRLGDSNPPDVIIAVDCIRVVAGSYVVFARSPDARLNGGLPAGSISGTFRFSMIAGTATAPGDVAIVAGTAVVDAVTWTRSAAGAALALDPDLVDPIANDTESNFCDATTSYGLGDLGTPGAENAQCTMLPGAGLCDDGGVLRTIVPPAPGQLVISEFLANPANVASATDAQREWFEVANAGASAFDLNELLVGRIGAAGAPVQSARCIAVPPGGFAVFARSADPAVNGNLPSVDATFRFGLVDTSGDIQVSQVSQVSGSATILDTVRWSSVTSGATQQLDPAHLTTADNDVATHFCAGTTAYGDLTNQGTPGTANPPCP